jgi:hypothetical protein
MKELPMNLRLDSETAARHEALSSEERAKEFLAWADSFPDRPLLSDEAVSRESMYPDRW